jgi:hypothetical protein
MPDEIRPGLWRWSAPHPEWQPFHEDGTPRDWQRDVGCVLYAAAGRAVFIDPQAPDGDQEFWRWADERCAGSEVIVLETTPYHRRSRDELIARYDASTAAPAAAVSAHPLPAFGETVYWIAEHRALVPGDVVIGAGGGELRLCPDSWLEDFQPRPLLADLREALEPLAALGPELVLVSHGEPALRDADAALRRALRAT